MGASEVVERHQKLSRGIGEVVENALTSCRPENEEKLALCRGHNTEGERGPQGEGISPFGFMKSRSAMMPFAWCDTIQFLRRRFLANSLTGAERGRRREEAGNRGQGGRQGITRLIGFYEGR